MMFAVLTLLSTLAQASTVGTLDCKAIYRTVDENDRGIEKVMEMPVTFAMGKIVKYELDLEGKFFSVMEDQTDYTLLGQITHAPDYTKGSVSRGVPDAKGQFSLSEVNGFTVHRLQCRKLPAVNPPRVKL